ncbi:hypothetical protein [Nocardioides sp. TF02-7]|uniref:hypothetical protein n=1 Tax=Nocardioides sp. TF02-7 TaxID=2917724 RepID=UPI001F0690C2|nr:hypothetical protein [Nocardioides sp. TF02-7]UMG94624.1 hypothetical protein MF408_12175 [Nocardioides sp. TF02-7]
MAVAVEVGDVELDDVGLVVAGVPLLGLGERALLGEPHEDPDHAVGDVAVVDDQVGAVVLVQVAEEHRDVVARAPARVLVLDLLVPGLALGRHHVDDQRVVDLGERGGEDPVEGAVAVDVGEVEVRVAVDEDLVGVGLADRLPDALVAGGEGHDLAGRGPGLGVEAVKHHVAAPVAVDVAGDPLRGRRRAVAVGSAALVVTGQQGPGHPAADDDQGDRDGDQADDEPAPAWRGGRRRGRRREERGRRGPGGG